ncbi:hypothetical protein WJX81_002875 [Elliptochloris bilobata]|uniref:Uncharacterized protein n=1 Tax=Elliptochloris bilobata TaxID=381761 RepID=A0AAW1RZP3_9CHLO
MQTRQVPFWRTLLAAVLAALLAAAAAADKGVHRGLSGRRALAGVGEESAVRRLATGGVSLAGGLGSAIYTGGSAYSSGRVSLTLGQPASSGTAVTAPLGVRPTAAATAAPAVSLTIAPRVLGGVTAATSTGSTTPQTLQTQSSPFGMSFVDATGMAAGAASTKTGATGGTALTGGTAVTVSGPTSIGKAAGGGTALTGGTAVTLSTLHPIGGAGAEAGTQPCNAMSTYNAPSNCGRVPVASLAPTPVPTQPVGPVWVPT